jgi:hypothetical protein
VAEVLAEFAGPIVGDNAVAYRAQAVGSPRPDGLWEGWIEFIPVAAGRPLRTPRETTQPNRQDALYWATGLTAVYLQGSLERALHPVVRNEPPAAHAVFDQPAPRHRKSTDVPVLDAVLDPFSVYEKGEALLRKELGALDAWHLVNIIRAYGLSEDPTPVIQHRPASLLVEMIVEAVRERSLRRP